MSYYKRFKKYVSINEYKELKENFFVNGLTEEHKEKIRESNIGWKHTPETIEKLKKIQSAPRANRVKTYRAISPCGKNIDIKTRKKFFEFIANEKLSQRKVKEFLNKGKITEKSFKFITKDSKKTIGWEFQII